jgi:hypothetical protein
MHIIHVRTLNKLGDSIIGFRALIENRHRDVMKTCGTAIGGGASNRSPSVDLSAQRRMRGDDEGTMHDLGRPCRSTDRHEGGSHLEMPTALRIGGQSVECQIDCESCQPY